MLLKSFIIVLNCVYDTNGVYLKHFGIHKNHIYIYIYMRPTLQLLEGQTDRSHKAYTGNFGIWHVSVELQDFQHCTASRVASTQ